MDRNIPLLKEKEINTDSLGHALTTELIDGLILEFGVFSGATINRIARKFPASQIYGFDSFEGFPADWETVTKEESAAVFSVEQPAVEKNVTLIKGWFSEVLPDFLEENTGPLSLVHVDCDIYQSTKDIFELIHGRIVPGTVMVFDEITNLGRLGLLHEMKALFELVRDHSLSFGWLNHGYDAGCIFKVINENPELFASVEEIRMRFGFHQAYKAAAAIRFK